MAELRQDFMKTVKDYLLENNKSLALIGIMGVGKSEVGARLSSSLQLPLREADEEIVKTAGMTIKEIFDKHGEAYFREMEREVTDRLLNEPSILSAGGGAYVQDKTREVIDRKAVSVWLHDDPLVIYERIKDDKARPIINNMSYEEFDNLLAGREPFYTQALIHVDCRGLGIDEVAEKVLSNSAERLTL